MSENNIIYISGCPEEEIKRLLKWWIDRYSGEIDNQAKFYIHTLPNGNYIVEAPESLNNKLFCSLTYHLKYYHEDDIENQFDIIVEGMMEISDAKMFKQQFIGQRFFLCFTDFEDLNYEMELYVVSPSNEVFEVDIESGYLRKSHLKKTYKELEVDQTTIVNTQEIRVYEQITPPPTDEELQTSAQRRFNIIAIATIALLAANIFLENKYIYPYINIGLCYALCLWWLLFDYFRLQIKRYYISSFLLAIIVMAGGLILKKYDADFGDSWKALVVGPISFLLLFGASGLIHKPVQTFGRKSLTESPKATLLGCLYSLLLLGGTILILRNLYKIYDILAKYFYLFT